MEGVIDHKMDPAIADSNSDKYIATRHGRYKLRKTTSGCTLLIKWKDGSESLIHLKDSKESHPVEVAEYTKSCDIASEATFVCWVLFISGRGTPFFLILETHQKDNSSIRYEDIH